MQEESRLLSVPVVGVVYVALLVLHVVARGFGLLPQMVAASSILILTCAVAIYLSDGCWRSDFAVGGVVGTSIALGSASGLLYLLSLFVI